MTDTLAAQRVRAARRVVVKLGSAQLVDEHGGTCPLVLGGVAADIAKLRKDGKQVVIVSSGAVALGRSALGLTGKSLKLEEKQAAAATGQIRLMRAWEDALATHNLPVAQALLTVQDTETRRRWLNARATLNTLLGAGAVPIVNENDTVATEEIRYGDNDRLGARVAQMIGADILFLLSDIDGLYTADPRNDRDARHIPIVEALTPDIMAMGGGANKTVGMGSGGMATKLEAARIALTAGCSTVITLGRAEDHAGPLSALADSARATWIISDISPETARRQWLSGSLNPSGVITVDAGAAKALKAGKSLLPAGVTAVSGRFERGDAIEVRGPQQELIARGVSAYSSEDAARIKGRQSADIETVLGYKGRPALIHRDDMVLMTSAQSEAMQ